MNEVNGLPGTPPAARRDRRGHKGLWIPASITSVLVHALILLGISFEMQVEPRVSSAPSRIIHVAPAMQAYDIVEVAGDPVPIEVQILERAPLRAQPVRPVAPVTPAAGEESAGERAAVEPVDPRSVRDRLRYHLTTPQVWRPPSEEILLDELTPQDLVERRIASQLGEYNDSVAAEAAALARSTDWTVTDADGGRWGVSPGGIHLGSITIPLGNSQFAVAPGRREEFAGRVRTWNELQDQAVREEARETFKDRVRAIEDRMDRERAARSGVAAPPPPATPARADTAGTGASTRGN
ncbi:MAG: hypothetical protein KFH98_08970 [Gemmatimonadetes bacterium]|nr:hypothetical protein [Gemmatimonadota bacterium]